MNYVTSIFMFLAFGNALEVSCQDFLIYPDSSVRVVKLLRSYEDTVVTVEEGGKRYEIKIRQLWMVLSSQKIHHVEIVDVFDNKPSGFLYEVTDHHVKLIQIKPDEKKIKVLVAPIEEIRGMRIKRIGGKIAWIGAGFGLVSGTVIGFAVGDTKGNYLSPPISAEEHAGIYGFSFAVYGALIGRFIGKQNLRIEVNCKAENLAKHRKKLVQYSINKPQFLSSMK